MAKKEQHTQMHNKANALEIVSVMLCIRSKKWCYEAPTVAIVVKLDFKGA